ncbi:MAG: hypothetical protein DWQ36_13915 [Acidobacteria bacterium]|nr:MAG: hypothetical protein DWQ30_20040 [Acidobacteriota bacterium]REK06398.1 MAG: hypothetical protein DWQ36_13915 [Acidobacteriota bacterium]
MLWHSYQREPCGCDEAKCLGVFSTREAAEHSIARLSSQPGFRDHPEGFVIDPYEVDLERWQDGFSSA